MSSHIAANLEIFACISVVGLAIILTIVSAISYRRLRHPRALFIGWSFLIFAVKGGYLVSRSVELRGSEPWVLTVALMDLVILALLYLALRIR